METRLLLGLVAAAFGATLGGCSSSSPGPFADVSAFCQQKAKAECQYAPTCAIDIPTCQSHRAAICNAEATAATSSGARKYMSGKAQACIDAWNAAFMKSSSRVLFADLVGRGSITDLCERVFSGNVGAEKACTIDYDCADNRICSPASPGASLKVCADPVPATTLCANPGEICPVDMYCGVMNSVAQCQAAAAKGQPCSSSVPCVSALRCLANICQDRALASDPCTTSDDCPVADPYCDPSAGSICTAGLTYATGAADCSALKGGSPVVGPIGDSGLDAAAE